MTSAQQTAIAILVTLGADSNRLSASKLASSLKLSNSYIGRILSLLGDLLHVTRGSNGGYDLKILTLDITVEEVISKFPEDQLQRTSKKVRHCLNPISEQINSFYSVVTIRDLIRDHQESKATQ
ncbi:Rrf2 family transcriptional regulator [Vibrio mediterranei]